jgi:hypothetical protein
VGVGRGDDEFEAVGESGAGAGSGVKRDGGFGGALLDEDPSLEAAAAIVLEGTVGDELGVEAAVVGVVDFLGHDAVEGGADLGGGVQGVNGEGGGGLSEGVGGGEDEEGEDEAHGVVRG